MISNVTPVLADWGSSVESTESAINVETGFQQWAYACTLRLDANLSLDPGKHHWVALRLAVKSGAFGVGLLRGDELVHERFATDGEKTSEIYLPLDDVAAEWVVLRNVAENGLKSLGTIESAQIVSQPKLLSSLPK